MSAVKLFALVLSMVMMVAIQSAPGGSMHPSASAHHPRSTGRIIHDDPTTLVYATSPDHPITTLNIHHTASAENLAGPTFGGFTPTPPTAYTPVQATGPALSLGVTNGGGPASLGTVENAPISSYSPQPSPSLPAAPSSNHPDAFINFGNAPFLEANSLTTGNPVGFFQSPVFTQFFGSVGPSINDVGLFEKEVLATIKATYNNAGLPINLTIDPTVMASHMLSVVSGASYSGGSNAIGITDVGNNGFSFIDKFAGVQSVDQLAIAIGHNISHELMHAFGIANHPEQTGPYVDAATSTLQTLSDPSTGFSQAAASLLSTLNFQAVGQSVVAGAQRIDGDQILIAASTVPEPSTVAVWVLAGGFVAARRRRKGG